MEWLWVIDLGITFGLLWAIARIEMPYHLWLLLLAGITFLMSFFGLLFGWATWFFVLLLVVAAPLAARKVRLKLVDKAIDKLRPQLPAMSESEKIAIEAGTVWWEAELFRGNPDWSRLFTLPRPELSREEQAFLDGPVEELCAMLNDWRINDELHDLPPEVWAFIKAKGFFGMIIPKSYGGLEFSALAHSAVVQKVASRSGVAAITVMVPNSLGPAELLMAYGTEEQKRHYLPRLARGIEVPCFALTGPTAGSDAGSIPDYGIVCRRMHDGVEKLGMLVTWEKRYITLGPVATVLGLAFKVYDPEHLLGGKEELGITCALIPTDTPGIEIGNRHNPLGNAFLNGPNRGHEVFVPLEWVIGGRDGIGNGWRMLMERLAVGRGISLPATSVGAAKLCSRASGAYSRVRKQFKLPIGKFEGVEEPLARIGGLTYLADSARLLTLTGLDMGEKPSVVSAIVKYNLTEIMRTVVNDAMDVHGGKGICMGPANYLGRTYQSVPVGITVEGANILTRSLIIFGQGAMRCHPFLIREMEALLVPGRDAAVEKLEAALAEHAGYALVNGARAFVYGVSSRLAPAPQDLDPQVRQLTQQLARFSAALAFSADIGLLILGGDLKRREKLSGRYADLLGNLYLASAAIKRFVDDGCPEADRPLLAWACHHAMEKMQEALDGIVRNFPLRYARPLLRLVLLPLGRNVEPPSDKLGHQVASLLLAPSEARDRLTGGIVDSGKGDPASDVLAALEEALRLTLLAEPIERRLRDQKRVLPACMRYEVWLQSLLIDGHLNGEEAETLRRADAAVARVLRVDEFTA